MNERTDRKKPRLALIVRGEDAGDDIACLKAAWPCSEWAGSEVWAFPMALGSVLRARAVIFTRLSWRVWPLLACCRLLRKKTLFLPRELSAFWFGEHDYSLVGGILRKVAIRRLFRWIDLTLCASAETAARLREFLDDARYRVRLTPPTVPPPPPGDAPGDGVGFMTVLDLSRTTFHSDALALFDRLARALPEFPFYLVGRLDSDAAEAVLGLAPNCLRFDYDLLDWAYRNSAVYCQFSETELTGARLAEAIGKGLSALAFDSGALPEAAFARGEIVSRSESLPRLVEIARKLATRPRSAPTAIAAAAPPEGDTELERAIAELLGPAEKGT